MSEDGSLPVCMVDSHSGNSHSAFGGVRSRGLRLSIRGPESVLTLRNHPNSNGLALEMTDSLRNLASIVDRGLDM